MTRPPTPTVWTPRMRAEHLYLQLSILPHYDRSHFIDRVAAAIQQAVEDERFAIERMCASANDTRDLLAAIRARGAKKEDEGNG
jgi:hypothetical protein